MSEAPERLAPGTVLDLGRRYRVERFLGAGGFAEVYKADEIGIGRPVALKLLGVGAHARPVHKQRFFREAQAAARIRHRDVVTILAHGVAPDGRPYIVQDFLDGCDVAAAIEREGSLSPDRVVPLFVGAFDALAAAHEAGVVHRDIKPANLFLDRVGTHRERLVVLDFGVAFLHEQLDDRLTATGGFLGTPRYMAPEYIEQRAVSPALDVYQMGLVLVEALSGRPAVDADNAYQSMVAHVNGELVVPLWIEASPLGPLLRAALDRDPTRRPTPGALRDALAAIDPSAIQPVAVDAALGEAETIDSGRLAVAETADSDEAGPSGSVPTIDPRWVELMAEGAREPPPIPYAAYLRDRPATEALSLSLFGEDGPDAAVEAALRRASADRTVRVEPEQPRRRVGPVVIVGLLLVAVAGAIAALDWRSAGPAAGADAMAAGRAGSDASVDGVVGDSDAMPLAPERSDAIVVPPRLIVIPPRPARSAARRAEPARPRPGEGPKPPIPGAGDPTPTTGDLLRWRIALPGADAGPTARARPAGP